MKRFVNLLLFILLFYSSVFSQRNIQSRVFDETNGESLEMATVRLLNPNDSSLVKGVQSNVRGGFILNDIKKGNYILIVSSVGYHDYKTEVTMEDKNIILKNIHLKEDAQLLSEITVKGTAAQMIVRNDTLEYNAGAFKTAENAVVEDLLKRLPGVEVAQDGKITVNGEEIKNIRVDGKKFFDGDIEMATKNLPAEMIDKIQVLDQKSDMAKLTGFEDDETERIINLTTKANRKKGVFSNIGGGIGLDIENNVRYDVNGVANFISGDTQTTVTAGANNINTARSIRGRTNNSNGITDTQNFGANNNTIVNDKLVIGGDASFNHSKNQAITDSYKLSYLKDSTYTDSTLTVSNNENFSTNIRFELEWKPDSMNTFIIQPNIGYTKSFNDNSLDFIYLVEEDTTSVGNSFNYGESDNFNGDLNFIYNRKFRKKGRTLTANVNTSISNNDNESYNYSYRSGTKNDTIDQYTTNVSNRYNAGARVSFVEPLWNEKNLLETVLSFHSSASISEKNQYKNSNLRYYNNLDEYIDYSGNHDVIDTEYSNDFKNVLLRETVELNYRHNEKDYNLTLGIKAEPSQTYSYTTYGDGKKNDVENNVVNLSPTGRFRYNFGKKKYFRIDYRGTTSQPSISQLQPVKNNSNLMNQTIGNAALNPAFSHRFTLFYSGFNDQRFSSFNTFLHFDFTQNALVTNTIYDSTGKRHSQTVNSKSSPINVSATVSYNTPLVKKRLHFNTYTSLGFNQRYGYSSTGYSVNEIDIEQLPLGEKSSTQVYSAGENLSLTFTHETIEVGARGSINYRNTINNLNTKPTETWDYTASGNVVLHLPYNININTDLNYITRKGYSGFDKSELIWDASIDKSLFKNRGNLSLKFADILRQRKNIRQYVGDNYIQFSQTNSLTSYFLLSFSYKINRFNGTNVKEKDTNEEPLPKPRERQWQGGERPPHGQGRPPRPMF